MDVSYLSRAEHEEFRHGTNQQHEALAKRIDNVEQDVAGIRQELAETRQIASDIRAIQTNIQHMLDEQRDQGERLKGLEDRSLNVRLEHAEHAESDLERRVNAMDQKFDDRMSAMDQKFDERMGAIEQKPGKRWETFVGALLAAAATTIASMVINGQIG